MGVTSGPGYPLKVLALPTRKAPLTVGSATIPNAGPRTIVYTKPKKPSHFFRAPPDSYSH